MATVGVSSTQGEFRVGVGSDDGEDPFARTVEPSIMAPDVIPESATA